MTLYGTIAQNKPPINGAVRYLRGARGASDIDAIAPLELTRDDKLKLTPCEFVQTSNLAIWNINHDLDKRYPIVRIFDNTGEEVEGDIIPMDNSNLQIIFSEPTIGTAILI